jgi:ABC-type nitrate/sulfonate/bicarbonate transport system substrate-binding protein
MTKLLNIIIVVLALALVAVILYPQIQENRPAKLRFACDSSACCLPFLIGVEESTFVQNKIIPELVFYSDPKDALAALFEGRTDVGVFPWAEVFQYRLETGKDFKAFMSEDFRQSLPVDGIVVPVKSRVNRLADLKKRKLGYPPQFRHYVSTMLANINLAPKEITLVEVPFSAIVEQLRAGQIDAAWLLEPLICPLDTARFRVVQDGVLPRFVSSPFPGAAIGFSAEFLETTPKVVLSRLKMACDAAVALAETQPDRAKLIMAKYFPYCAEVCGTCRIPELERLVELNRPAVSALASRLTASGALADTVETEPFFVEPIKLAR